MKSEFVENTGLTPVQYEAVNLLISGESLTTTAQKCNVSRPTLYTWLKNIAFCCYYNQRKKELQTELKTNLYNLKNLALASLNSCLNSNNEAIRLQAAKYIIDKIESDEVGQCDLRTAIHNEVQNEAQNLSNFDFCFDDKEFNKRLRNYGLK